MSLPPSQRPPTRSHDAVERLRPHGAPQTLRRPLVEAAGHGPLALAQADRVAGTQVSSGQTIGIIGVGDIAEAIVEGLSSDVRPPQIRLSPRNAARSAALAQRFENVDVCESNAAVVDTASALIVAVRPEDAEAALAEVAIPPDVVVISVMAGVGGTRLRRLIRGGSLVVRAMPLPAVRSRTSITAVLPDHPVSTALFDRLGGALPVSDGATFDVLSSVTATMSTYFGFLAVVAGWAASHGVDHAEAERYVRDIFGNLGTTLQETRKPLTVLTQAHQTRGGLNEQLHDTWLLGSGGDALRSALDAVLERVRA